MKRHSQLYTFLAILLINMLQTIPGYTADDVRKEVSEIEKLYRYKCSLCHSLPDIEATGYTYEHMLNIMNPCTNPADTESL